MSYTFFNLSGSDCSLTAYGSDGNPAAYSQWAQNNGWSNYYDNIGGAGLFNPNGLGGDPNNQSSAVTNNYLFFNNYDPIDSTTVPSSAITLNNGVGSTGSLFITSGQLGPVSGNESINYPAMGDSWGVSCYGSNTIAVANLASAASVLQSNGPTTYPYTSSLTGWFYNADINPPAWSGCNAAGNSIYTNPCGVGFTSPNPSPGNQILNWNVASDAPTYSAMGGLWSGVNYNNSGNSYAAANLLNVPMLPINLSAYVQTKSR